MTLSELRHLDWLYTISGANPCATQLYDVEQTFFQITLLNQVEPFEIALLNQVELFGIALPN